MSDLKSFIVRHGITIICFVVPLILLCVFAWAIFKVLILALIASFIAVFFTITMSSISSFCFTKMKFEEAPNVLGLIFLGNSVLIGICITLFAWFFLGDMKITP